VRRGGAFQCSRAATPVAGIARLEFIGGVGETDFKEIVVLDRATDG
jgi:hypothetical protein